MLFTLGFDDYYCQDTDAITCQGANEDACSDLGCCWDNGCTHSMGNAWVNNHNKSMLPISDLVH